VLYWDGTGLWLLTKFFQSHDFVEKATLVGFKILGHSPSIPSP
jgi:hypothetical protein